MWGKFGNVIFQLNNTPETLQLSSRAKLTRISLFGEKEKLHFTGLEADTLEISIKLHSSFCNPAEESALLKEYLQGGKSFPLIIGDYIKGKYVLEAMREEVKRTDKRGNPLLLVLNLTLIEDKDAENQT